MEAAEDGSLSQGEIFSNEATVSDSDHLPEGPWAPSDAREAQRINGKSVTSPVQFRAWQDKPIGASAAVGKGARRGDNLGEEPERCFLTARIGVRREQHASDSSTTNFKKKIEVSIRDSNPRQRDLLCTYESASRARGER